MSRPGTAGVVLGAGSLDHVDFRGGQAQEGGQQRVAHGPADGGREADDAPPDRFLEQRVKRLAGQFEVRAELCAALPHRLRLPRFHVGNAPFAKQLTMACVF